MSCAAHGVELVGNTRQELVRYSVTQKGCKVVQSTGKGRWLDFKERRRKEQLAAQAEMLSSFHSTKLVKEQPQETTGEQINDQPTACITHQCTPHS